MHNGSGALAMTWNRPVRTLCLFLVGVIVAVGVGLAYRAFISHWEGDVRATLISATMSGIAIFAVSNLALYWMDRREHLTQRPPQD
jgi:predicted exporter